MDEQKLKRCYKCGESKAHNAFYKSIHKSDGLSSECKECRRFLGRERYKKQKDRIKKVVKRYRDANKDKVKIAISRCIEKNKEYYKTKRAEYYQKNKDELIRKASLWAQNNPEKRRKIYHAWKTNNRDRYEEHQLRWKEKNEEQYKLMRRRHEHKRRAKKAQTSNRATIAEINKLIEDSNNICFWCDEPIPKGQMHIDHIYPLSKNGDDSIYNLAVSCAKCNCKKQAKDPEVFLEEVLAERNKVG